MLINSKYSPLKNSKALDKYQIKRMLRSRTWLIKNNKISIKLQNRENIQTLALEKAVASIKII
jgi:hypothetical protein